jgi:hypothetical protein
MTYPVSEYWHSLQNAFDGATTLMGIRMMTSDTDYKYPLQVLYLCLSKVIVAVKYDKGKGKAIPLQAWTSPEGPRRSRFPDFKTIGT